MDKLQKNNEYEATRWTMKLRGTVSCECRNGILQRYDRDKETNGIKNLTREPKQNKEKKFPTTSNRHIKVTKPKYSSLSCTSLGWNYEPADSLFV